MEYLKLITREELQKLYRKRKGEKKIGDVCQILFGINPEKELKETDAQFVILGLPEDIGVRANLGRGGAHTAWLPALKNLLNVQSNHYLSGKELLILGSVNFDDLLIKSQTLDAQNIADLYKLRKMVEEIDQRVEKIISAIIKYRKIPIIIGGGHNNAYPNIVGASKALNKKINIINCDAHSDFRPLEGRHSGNGFSYAYHNNYLNKYFIAGLHEGYNSETVLNSLLNNKDVRFETFENVFIKEKLTFKEMIFKGIKFVKSRPCGVEIDMDTVQNIPSSAKTSSGISANMARQYAYWCGKNLNTLYFHIAEAAPILSHLKADNKTGKLIAYLITDFIKGVNERKYT